MEKITLVLLDEICADSKKRSILDAGCGTGAMMNFLARYAGGGDIYGIDLAQTALEFCRRRNHRLLAQASITHLPFTNEIFDLVTSFDVLQQLPETDLDALAIKEMFRVLKPGGVCFVRVAAYERLKSGHDAALSTHHRYNLDELKAKLETAGFEVVRTTYANSYLLPVAVVRRLLLKKIGLADKGSDVKPMPPNLAWLNRIFTKILEREAKTLQNPKAKLAFGLSAICLARKPL
jgi:SAM-dependent methyltransferase